MHCACEVEVARWFRVGDPGGQHCETVFVRRYEGVAVDFVPYFSGKTQEGALVLGNRKAEGGR